MLDFLYDEADIGLCSGAGRPMLSEGRASSAGGVVVVLLLEVRPVRRDVPGVSDPAPLLSAPDDAVDITLSLGTRMGGTAGCALAEVGRRTCTPLDGRTTGTGGT